jgi:hypothetical protein
MPGGGTNFTGEGPLCGERIADNYGAIIEGSYPSVFDFKVPAGVPVGAFFLSYTIFSMCH